MVKLTDSEIRELANKRNKDKERQEIKCNCIDSLGNDITKEEAIRRLRAIQKNYGLYYKFYLKLQEMAGLLTPQEQIALQNFKAEPTTTRKFLRVSILKKKIK